MSDSRAASSLLVETVDLRERRGVCATARSRAELARLFAPNPRHRALGENCPRGECGSTSYWRPTLGREARFDALATSPCSCRRPGTAPIVATSRAMPFLKRNVPRSPFRQEPESTRSSGHSVSGRRTACLRPSWALVAQYGRERQKLGRPRLEPLHADLQQAAYGGGDGSVEVLLELSAAR